MERIEVVAAAADGAAGAPALQVAIGALLSLAVFVPMAWFLLRERAGRPTGLGRAADWLAPRFGMPRWAALPMVMIAVSGASAVAGLVYDQPFHMEFGRDEGPLANVSHYPIFFGLLGILASGVAIAALASDSLPARTIRIAPGWRVPLSSVFITLTGLIAVSGFPADDLWHRLFGADVTEWGPTHIQMIIGGVSVVLGATLLLAESRQVGAQGRWLRPFEILATAAWLVGAGLMLFEFELGLPQFPLANQAVVTFLLAGWTLVYARLTFGRGGALATVAIFVALRVVFYLGGIPGGMVNPTPLPLIAEALLVEALALVVATERRYLFGALGGLLIGSVGLLAEWPITHWYMPVPWEAHSIPMLMAFGVPAGIAGGLIGAWQSEQVGRISAGAPAPDGRSFAARHGLVLLAVATVVGLFLMSVPRTATEQPTATVTYQDVTPSPRYSAYVTVALDPSVVDRAHWFYAFSWQGLRGDPEGKGWYNIPFVEVEPGRYRTAEPLPMFGSFKANIRLQLGVNDQLGVLLYAPADPGVPVDEVAVASGSTVPFTSEVPNLLREQKRSVPDWWWTVGYSIEAVIFLAAFLAFGLLYANAASGRPSRSRTRGITSVP